MVGLLSGLYHLALHLLGSIGSGHGGTSGLFGILYFSYAALLWPLCPLQHIAYAIIAHRRSTKFGLCALFLHYAGVLSLWVALDESWNGRSGHGLQDWLAHADAWQIAVTFTPFLLLNLWYTKRLLQPVMPAPIGSQ